MGFLKNPFQSKREPEWQDVGEVGEKDPQSELTNRARAMLRQKGRSGSLDLVIYEYRQGAWGNTSEELSSWVFISLSGMNAQLSQEARRAIDRGDVWFIVGHISGNSPIAGCRCIAVVSMK